MENDNGHDGNVVVVSGEQSTKISETGLRVNRPDGAVSDAGIGIEKAEEVVVETAVVEENDSDLVGELPLRSSSARVPFTNLSQIDADLALARTLQEQERAYMMLTMNSEVNDYGSWETGSFVYDEDEFDDEEIVGEEEDDDDDDDEYETDNDPQEDAADVNTNEDGGRNSENEEVAYTDDEAYARALQEAEERDMAARLSALTGLANRVQDLEDDSHTSEDEWDEMDPDELSYEELLALGDMVGTQSRGLSADTIALLPSKRYKSGDSQNGTNESCVICRLDYEDDDDLILLPCKHSYHSECINNWLKINKVCPVCSAEVSTSSSGQS
ncbi:unnamed protein product [Cochlearia groenlandica]